MFWNRFKTRISITHQLIDIKDTVREYSANWFIFLYIHLGPTDWPELSFIRNLKLSQCKCCKYLWFPLKSLKIIQLNGHWTNYGSLHENIFKVFLLNEMCLSGVILHLQSLHFFYILVVRSYDMLLLFLPIGFRFLFIDTSILPIDLNENLFLNKIKRLKLVSLN